MTYESKTENSQETATTSASYLVLALSLKFVE
jgi:hypothetical protein